MSSLVVDTNLLKELLNAAAGTALTHRGSEYEIYVLGQLEATANLAYVMCSHTGNEELEILCQQLALDALNRLSELSPKTDSGIREKAQMALSSKPFQTAKAS